MTGHPEAGVDQAESRFVLQEAVPLSRSVIWRIQRRYFEQAGIEAWSGGAVPMWVTSNPLIAGAYAAVVEAYLSDCANILHPEQPVYLVELGAGSGRLAFNFLRAITALFAQNGRPASPLRYVMTDYNPALLDFWQQHPALRSDIDAGLLDFALFDASAPGELALRHSGEILSPGRLANPLVLLANYFFDSVPQDAFYFQDGQVFESYVSIVSSQPEPNPEDPDLFGRLRLEYERRLVTPPYYNEPILDVLLEEYRTDISGTALAIPATGLRCLEFFRTLAAGRMLLLTSDKGYHCPEDLAGRREPGIEVHGSFSMGVNYHAVASYFRRNGGQSLQIPHRTQYLDTGAYLLGADAAGYPATERAFAANIAQFTPEDFYLLQSTLKAVGDTVTPQQALAWLRLSHWDGHILQACFAGLLAGLPGASEIIKGELRDAIRRLAAGYYHLGEDYDLPYDLGVLSYRLNDHHEALRYFEQSLALYGRGPKVLYNMALCYYLLHDSAQAVACAAEAERLDPEFDPPRALRRKLEAGSI